jgi:hypothetical protein
MAQPKNTFGRFSWKLNGGGPGAKPFFLSGQPFDQTAARMFDRNGRRGAIALHLSPTCTEQQALKFQESLNDTVSEVGLLEFDEGLLG